VISTDFRVSDWEELRVRELPFENCPSCEQRFTHMLRGVVRCKAHIWERLLGYWFDIQTRRYLLICARCRREVGVERVWVTEKKP